MLYLCRRMIFSRSGRSLAKSTRCILENGVIAGGYGARSSILFEESLTRCGADQNSCLSGIGTLRGYLTSAAGASKFVALPRSRLGDWNLLFSNPKFRRFFSTETPKKKDYENYHPKENKGIPKYEEKANSQSKEDSYSNEDLTKIFLLVFLHQWMLEISYQEYEKSQQMKDKMMQSKEPKWNDRQPEYQMRDIAILEDR